MFEFTPCLDVGQILKPSLSSLCLLNLPRDDFQITKRNLFFPKDWLEKCKDKCEEEFRLLLNGDERLCAVGWSAAHQVNSGQSLGEVVLHQLGEGCEDLSGAFYQHRLHACSRSQRELRKRKRKKVSVK